MKDMTAEKHAARILAVVLLLFGVSACSAGESGGSSGIEAGLKISGEATAQDVGLPNYPRAKSYKEPGDSSSGANIGVSTPAFGLKVAAVKLESDDRPEQVASFYRKALSKYGNVLDCNDATAATGKSTGSDELKCEPTDVDGHSHVYKVGTEKNQRIVAIKPYGKGTRFDLVHVNVRD